MTGDCFAFGRYEQSNAEAAEPTTTAASSLGESDHRVAAFRPAGAVGYQLHYRDYGDHAFASKEVNFDEGFGFSSNSKDKERPARPSSYLETYSLPAGGGGTSYFSSFRSLGGDADDAPRYRVGLGSLGALGGLGAHAGHGYRQGLVTRDVDAVTAGGGSKRSPLVAPLASPLGSSAPTSSALVGLGHSVRAFPDHTRSLVSRGNIGYILVDPLGELPTIRIHASLVNSPSHGHAAASAPFPRYAPAPVGTPGPTAAAAAVPARSSFLFSSTSDPFHVGGLQATALRRVDTVDTLGWPAVAATSTTTTTSPPVPVPAAGAATSSSA